MSAGKRYKFNGSHVMVQTGLAAALAITGITNAEPPLVTATGSNLSIGDVVLIDKAMPGLDGQLYPVDNPETDDFELAGADSTGYPAFSLDSPNLATATPVVFSEFCELTGVTQNGGSADEIEVTTICSTAKEFEVGLSDSGTLQLDFNFAPNSAIQTAIRESAKAASLLAFKIDFPGDGGTVILTGFVQTSSFSGQVNGVWTGSATIKLSGELFVFLAEA